MMSDNLIGNAIRLLRATVAPNWAVPLTIDSITADVIGNAAFFQPLGENECTPSQAPISPTDLEVSRLLAVTPVAR